MAEAIIMDLTVVCQRFPKPPQPEINRDNILEAIDTIFEGETRIVIIEGLEGIGKTNTLAQFARKHPHNAFSLFVSYTSRWAYDPRILRLDLYNQINWVLNKEETLAAENIEEGLLLSRFYELNRYARNKRQIFYFILDGLDEIPKEDIITRDLILNLLPFGGEYFRFLLAGDYNQLHMALPPKIASKPYQLAPFTLDDTAKYLHDLVNDRSDIEEIHQLCSRIPGYLASVRRLLASGVDVKKIIDGDLSEPLEIFELEWREVDTTDEELLDILALLAHDRKKHSIDDVVRLLNISAERVNAILQSLGFVKVDPERGDVGFVSEAFRKFAAIQIRHLGDKINSILIEDLLEDPDSETALTYLPTYLEQAGRFEDILTYLSPEHFTQMLESSQSLSPVQQKADLGVRVAKRLGRNWDLIRLSMQKSALINLGGAKSRVAEIEARVALNDYESALTLAQSAVLKEDRLHLLAIVARKRREQSLPIDQELSTQIRQLYSQIDHKSLKGQATEIASELMYSDPKIAIELVEKATDTDSGENALDWALAKLSLAGFAANTTQLSSTDAENTEGNENVTSKIKDPRARRFTATAALLFKEYTAKEVIAEVEKLESTTDRLYILRKWAMNNRERSDAADVVDYALKLAIKTTPFTFNASVLRELAAPLPFILDENNARHLVGTFDSQQGTIETLGPTEDFIRLQLLLARAESRYDSDAARNRVGDVYLKVSYIDELDLKAVCLARLVSSLSNIDPDLKFEAEDSEKIHSAAKEEFKASIEQLLRGTAEHYEATRRAIRALAKFKHDMAFELVKSLNTQYRRDIALVDLFKSAVQIPIDQINLGFLETALDEFADPDLRDESHLAVIERLAGEPEKLKLVVSNALPFFDRIRNIRIVDERARACCLSYALLMKSDPVQHAGLAAHLLSLMDEAWQLIDVGWERVEAGFKIAEALASYSIEKSRAYIELTEKFRDEIAMDTESTGTAYLGCLRLAIRAFSGLLPKNLDTQEDLERLTNLINVLPANGERAAAWAEMSIRSYLSGRADLCKRLVNERVLPLWQSISENDSASRARCLIVISPALYFAHPQTCLENIAKLLPLERDEAYWEVCNVILRKRPADEPYDAIPGRGYDISFTDIVDICGLLELMETDSSIYHFIKGISDTVVSPEYKNSFSRPQKASIVERLNKIISSKLPMAQNIKHEGYKIVSEARVARIQLAIHQVRQNVWDDLASAARNIPNLADRGHVLSIIAAAMPSNLLAKRIQILEEAKELINQIPAVFDRVEHYESFASLSADISLTLSKSCIAEAMNSALQGDDPSLQRLQKRLIDLAFRIDPNLASTVAALADNDPAKVSSSKNLNNQLDILKLKKKMIDESPTGVELSTAEKPNAPQAAWRNLGGLNTTRVAPLHFDHTIEWIELSSGLPLEKAYPIWAWVIENAVRRYSKTDAAKTHLRPIFEATLQGGAMCEKIAARSSTMIKRTTTMITTSSKVQSTLIRAGEREKALEFLTDWFANGVHEYLKICDPYFGLDDLPLLQLLKSANPTCRVQILTSKEHNKKVPQPQDEAYLAHWRLKVSDQDPPETEIVIAGIEESGKSPIHDRWWLTSGGGVRVGTSYNSLGLTRDSEISILSPEEAEMREIEVDQCLRRVKREHEGKKVQYSLFTL
jgi:hypothetical protein